MWSARQASGEGSGGVPERPLEQTQAQGKGIACDAGTRHIVAHPGVAVYVQLDPIVLAALITG
jgi:hypothetical protein